MKKLFLAFILTIVSALLTTNAQAQTSEMQRGENLQVENNAVAQAPVKKRNDLTGMWLVNVQVIEPGGRVKGELFSKAFQLPQASAGTNSLAPFVATETFHSDGTFIENSLADYIAPQATPGQGLWALTGNGEFTLTFYGVLIGSVSDPQFQGTYKVRSKLTTNEVGDQFSGPFKIDIFDANGNLLFSLDGNAQGRRAALESL
jgi:hypothetical protein